MINEKLGKESNQKNKIIKRQKRSAGATDLLMQFLR